MPIVPRVRDTLQVTPVSEADGQYAVLGDGGAELFRLTGDGVFLLCQLDGRTSADELLLRFEEAFDREMSREELAGFLDGLDAAGAFVTDPQALRALTYLVDQSLGWRGGLADRRAQAADPKRSERRDGTSRRGTDSVVTQWWDHAVFHLNAGNLKHAIDVFERMADAAPADLRLREMARHLRFILDSEARQELVDERRDVTWELFDEVLGDMLTNGVCPRCSTPFYVELGATNRCSSCGASFSSWILSHATQGRRSSDALFGDHE